MNSEMAYWGQCKLKLTMKANQVKCCFSVFFFLRGGEPGVPGEKPLCRVENQQTQPTYDAESGNRTRATLYGGRNE